ncbi:MAG: glycosyltransferase family 2 protein [Clostridiaceae bacterium]|nr:glycosyltransferase family 2 protein [Clostridiaceae bacterium]
MKLSIAMIAKNEEKNIGKSLKAITTLDGKIEYEIIVVDTGSTDNTINIARQFTDKVYEHEWNNNFADMRNKSLSYCTGDWILVVDADEVLENPESLVSFIKSDNARKFNSAYIRIKNFTGQNKENYIFGRIMRMFKNEESTKYVGGIHEQVLNKKPIFNSEITFLHNGYSTEDYELMIYKLERNINMLKKELETVSGHKKIYTIFQLAQSYALANMKRESLKTIKEAYELANKTENGVKHTYVYNCYAHELFNSGRFKKVTEILEEALKVSESLDYYYMLSTSYLALGEYNKSLKYCERYFDLRERRISGELGDVKLVEVSYNFLDKVYLNKITCDFENKNYVSIIECFEKMNSEESRVKALDKYFLSSFKVGEFSNVKKYFGDKELEDDDIQMLVDINETIQIEEGIDKNLVLSQLSQLDSRLKYYINGMHFNEELGVKIANIDFRRYYKWKSDLLLNSILENEKNLSIIMKLNLDDQKKYINSLLMDYRILKLLNEYSENNLLNQDIKKLAFICNLEECLLFNKSIEDEKYKKLVLRALVNELSKIKKIYSQEFINSDCFIDTLNYYSRFWVELISILPLARENSLQYVKNLKNMLKKYPEMNRTIGVFMDNANYEPISSEMVQEKNNLLMAIESLIGENKVEEAWEITMYLNKIFPYDYKILNAIGVITYVQGKSIESVMYLALSLIFEPQSFDTLYNIASILQSISRMDDAKYFYKESLAVCHDELMIEEIKKVIE